MCLLSIVWQTNPEYPFVFAGNRDEFHDRASAPADWWDDTPDVLGGRDLHDRGESAAVDRRLALDLLAAPDPFPTEAAGIRVAQLQLFQYLVHEFLRKCPALSETKMASF